MLKTKIDLPSDYEKEIEKAINLLKKEGCEEVYIFGSLVKGEIKKSSDIDLAVRGCPSGKFFSILGKLIIKLDYPVDLIDLDKEKDFGKLLQEEGELIHVG